MPGARISVLGDPRAIWPVLERTAQTMGFSARTVGNLMKIQKGNLVASIFLGAFIAYCEFSATMQPNPSPGWTDLVLTRNTPWWTGAIGVSRVKNRLRELMNSFQATAAASGFQVSGLVEY